jgi:hypothetical protein
MHVVWPTCFVLCRDIGAQSGQWQAQDSTSRSLAFSLPPSLSWSEGPAFWSLQLMGLGGVPCLGLA